MYVRYNYSIKNINVDKRTVHSKFEKAFNKTWIAKNFIIIKNLYKYNRQRIDKYKLILIKIWLVKPPRINKIA